MKDLIVTILAISAFAAAAAGQSLSGTVKDQNGSAIAGAGVTLTVRGGGAMASTTTAGNGHYRFSRVPAGSYDLTVVATGFKPATRTVDIGSGAIDIDVALEIGETRVTVTADVGSAVEAVNVPQSVTVISADSIRSRATTVMAEAAREEAGLNVQLTSPTIGAIVVRGLTGKNVVNYVDGVRFTHAGQRGGINTFFNLNEASSFEAVEVVRGPSSAQYGSDSLGGTVNLRTITPVFGAQKPEFHGEFIGAYTSANRNAGGSGLFSYGNRTFGGYAHLFGRRVGDMRTAGGLDSHSSITRFLGLPSTILYKRSPDTGFKQYGGSGRLDFAPRPDQQLTVFYQRGQQDDGKRFDQLLGGDGNLIADLRNLMLDLGYVRYVKQGAGPFDSFSVTGSFNSQREERVNQGGQGNPFGDITHQYERTSVWGLSGFADRRLGRSNTFLVGADVYFERVNSPAYTVNGTTFAVSLSRPRVPDEARFGHGGVYIQDQWEAIPGRLKVTGALRYGAMRYRVRGSDAPVVGGRPLWSDDSLSDSGFSGRVGLLATVAPGLRLAFNYSRGFRYPSITDLGTLGLTGDGFETDFASASALGGTIGSSASASATNTGIPVSKLRSEFSNNLEGSVRYNSSRVELEFTAYRLDILASIVKQALILPAGSTGRFIGSEPITSQNANGAVFVALSSSPVLVRANLGDARLWGTEFRGKARLPYRVTLSANATYNHAADKATGLPPDIEGGTPPPTAFASIRKDWSRVWVEAYGIFAAKQDRLSSLDLSDRRTGAPRNRTQIENFFRRGACVRGLTFNAAGTCNAAVGTYTLRATGENITQVLTRVLGPGFAANNLFNYLPGYGIANLRGGFRLHEKAVVTWAFENVFDHYRRNPSWGIDGAGRSFTTQIRFKF
ncbi:MAG: TonB-dependent receptor [Acidobacteria bacterium]|nr:TonB-dependent receptor [Acidobacteriota bacterium]MCW5949635.1 TonB-dependent receptor [Pyrinomonadaceae bacterium]